MPLSRKHQPWVINPHSATPKSVAMIVKCYAETAVLDRRGFV